MSGPPLPRALQVEVTGACNLRCAMCLVRYREPLDRRVASLSFERFKALVDALPDLETVTLQGSEGMPFAAIVTDVDERGARIQLSSPPVVARIKANGLKPGDELMVRLDSADPKSRSVHFSVAG